MITDRQFRRIALACAGVVEGAHMGHPDFRAFERIFASIQGRDRGALKLTPEQQARFVSDASTAFVPESGACGRQGWTRVIFAAADEETVGEALTLAWQANAVAATARVAKGQRPPVTKKSVAKKSIAKKMAKKRDTKRAATRPAAPVRGSRSSRARSGTRPARKNARAVRKK